MRAYLGEAIVIPFCQNVSGSTVSLKFLRLSDGFWYDFNDSTFKDSAWVADSANMTQDSNNVWTYDWTTPRDEDKYQIVFVEGGILLLILGLGAYLRLENLVENPGWYSDEGTLLNIAHNLLQGDVRYLVINQSTLLVARLPLFPLILAGVSRYFGEGIAVLRTLTASLGLLSVGMCYLVVRRALERDGRWLAMPGTPRTRYRHMGSATP